jgi:hypothetical protein
VARCNQKSRLENNNWLPWIVLCSWLKCNLKLLERAVKVDDQQGIKIPINNSRRKTDELYQLWSSVLRESNWKVLVASCQWSNKYELIILPTNQKIKLQYLLILFTSLKIRHQKFVGCTNCDNSRDKVVWRLSCSEQPWNNLQLYGNFNAST